MMPALVRFTGSRRVAVVLMLATALLAGCGGGGVGRSASAQEASPDASSSAFTPVTLTSCDGFTSTVASPLKRVLVSGPPEAELLDKLGAADRLAGLAVPVQPGNVPQDLFDRIKDLPSLAPREDPFAQASAEVLAVIDPDFVLGGYDLFTRDEAIPSQAEYEADGVVSFLMKSSSCDEKTIPTADDFYADILDLGRVFGAEEKAIALFNELKAGHDALAKKLEGVTERPSVYLAAYYGDESFTDPPYFQGADSLTTALVAQAGGTSIFANEGGIGGPTSWEVIAAKAPEYIGLYDFGKDPDGNKAYYDEGRSEFLAFAPAASIPAVKNDRIFYVNADGLFGAYNLATLPALEAMARGLHPELFD
ncbi:MAG: ABC transporter substrate-binding protein [Egibacteraceae bacterium]